MNINVIKKLLPLILIAQTGIACAATPGAYVGAGIGYSNLNDMQDIQKQDDGGLGGRAFAGFNFNRYVGVEGHYALFKTAGYSLNTIPGVSIDYDLSALGLAGKLYFPATDKFNLYVSLGGAQMMGKLDARYNDASILNDSASALVLTTGLGASFDLAEHVTAGVDFTAYQGKGGDYSHNGIPASQMATVGLAYKF